MMRKVTATLLALAAEQDSNSAGAVLQAQKRQDRWACLATRPTSTGLRRQGAVALFWRRGQR